MGRLCHVGYLLGLQKGHRKDGLARGGLRADGVSQMDDSSPSGAFNEGKPEYCGLETDPSWQWSDGDIGNDKDTGRVSRGSQYQDLS